MTNRVATQALSAFDGDDTWGAVTIGSDSNACLALGKVVNTIG